MMGLKQSVILVACRYKHASTLSKDNFPSLYFVEIII